MAISRLRPKSRNTYLVPIQLLPSLAPGTISAPAVFYGTQLIVAMDDSTARLASRPLPTCWIWKGTRQSQVGPALPRKRYARTSDALKATISRPGKCFSTTKEDQPDTKFNPQRRPYGTERSAITRYAWPASLARSRVRPRSSLMGERGSLRQSGQKGVEDYYNAGHMARMVGGEVVRHVRMPAA